MSLAVPPPVSTTTPEKPKPRLRGWIHQWASLASVATGATLIAVTAATVGSRAALATAVYSATVTLLFGTSAMYHRITWGPRWRAWMKRLDHSMIFVFIAGTYTPFALLVLPGNTGAAVLAVVWGGALVGVTVKVIEPGGSRWLSVPCYLGLGYVAVFVLPALLLAGVAAFVLILVGGAIYSAGAFFYGLRRPDPLPHVFGYHELFHLCTVVAAMCHYVAVW